MKQNARQSPPVTPEGPDTGGMSRAERRAAGALASIFSLRMLGLFMILPVFTLHATRYSGYSATGAGLAIGIYGLTQALLQIPFGMLSDRIGRKPVIYVGLVIFALGSVVAALAHSMLWVIAGRALQGAGAVGSAVLALTADLTREEQRTKAMAMIGGSIGIAFGVGIVAGPVITSWVGLPGLFWVTAVLGLAGAAVLRFRVPNPVSSRFHRDAEAVPAQLGRVLRDTQLLRLDAGILCLHLILMASFVVMPLV
ncbi:MAG TPA: MFS transporter, partial [Longimicrobiales bacterium]|nr:MFS transporter [Longimicrobiales bacterium]